MADPKEIYVDLTEGGPAFSGRDLERLKFYTAVRHVLRHQFAFPQDATKVPEKPEDFHICPAGKFEDLRDSDFLEPDRLKFLGIYGHLLAHEISDPSYGRDKTQRLGSDDERVLLPGRTAADPTIPDDQKYVIINKRFRSDVAEAVRDVVANEELFQRVFRRLLTYGRTDDKNKFGIPRIIEVQPRQLAEITTKLLDLGVDPTSNQIEVDIFNAIAQARGGGPLTNAAAIDVQLPDLEAGVSIEIIPENLRAVSLVYFSAMLEEMKLWASVDKVVEHFMTGALPVSRGSAGQRIYDWIRTAPDRMTELERRSIYGRTIGVAQGAAADATPNREFSDLWVRFLSSVSFLSREQFSQIPKKVSAEQAQKSARDLAVNLTLHGYGIAHFAAIEMQRSINEMLEILSDARVTSAYGANDYIQLIERISSLYLGGAANGVRFRTMARAGAEIMLFLADNAPILASVSPANPALFLQDRLVQNVERWLAVTGTPDDTVERYSEPVDLATQPTIPALMKGNGVSSAVKEALKQVGVAGSAIPVLPQM